MKLEWYEFHGAVQVGLERWAQSAVQKLNHATTYNRTFLRRLNEEVIGACSERVLCKFWNIYWDGSINTFHRLADVLGYNVEVRGTHRPDGRLIVRDNDADDRAFVLITGEGPEFEIRGWLFGSEAKLPEWMDNPNGYRPSWFVPQYALRSLEPLAKILEERQC